MAAFAWQPWETMRGVGREGGHMGLEGAGVVIGGGMGGGARVTGRALLDRKRRCRAERGGADSSCPGKGGRSEASTSTSPLAGQREGHSFQFIKPLSHGLQTRPQGQARGLYSQGWLGRSTQSRHHELAS